MSDILVETRELKKYFKTPSGLLHAVDGINVQIQRGKTLGVVGESGCGKSTFGRVLLRLLDATGGEVIFDGENILKYGKKQMDKIYMSMQMVFQDPYSSLNPRMSVSELIADPIKTCKILKGKQEIEDRVMELIRTVGLDERFINSYPHELDGGRRQRIGIARALALNPRFVVCDEPVSALDVSIQAQILNLLMDLQVEKQLTYVFITHDLGVVKHISDDVMVMYLGQCVEKAPVDELFANPLHPYTEVLLDAVPKPTLESRNKTRNLIRGEITSPIEPKPGCRFASRCKYAAPECSAREYKLVEKNPGHFVSCAKFYD